MFTFFIPPMENSLRRFIAPNRPFKAMVRAQLTRPQLRQEARIVTHDHLSFKLPDRIQDNADGDQQSSGAQQLIATNLSKEWQDGHNAQEKRPSQGDPVENHL